MCVLLAAVACGDRTDDGDFSDLPAAEAAYDGPLHVARKDARHPKAGAAGDIVECRTFGRGGAFYGEEYRGGATAGSPEQALDHGRSEGLFLDLAFDGLAVAKREKDRVLFVQEHDGAYTEAIVVHDGPAVEGTGGPGWYVESWARCDYSELSGEVTEAFGVQVWTDLEGNPVPTSQIESWRGPAHCDWESMTFLHLDGNKKHAWVRRPDPELGQFFGEPWQAHAELPENAEPTGFMRDGNRLWLSPDRMRAYVGTRDDVEIWPRTLERLGCA